MRLIEHHKYKKWAVRSTVLLAVLVTTLLSSVSSTEN